MNAFVLAPLSSLTRANEDGTLLRLRHVAFPSDRLHTNSIWLQQQKIA